MAMISVNAARAKISKGPGFLGAPLIAPLSQVRGNIRADYSVRQCARYWLTSTSASVTVTAAAASLLSLSYSLFCCSSCPESTFIEAPCHAVTVIPTRHVRCGAKQHGRRKAVTVSIFAHEKPSRLHLHEFAGVCRIYCVQLLVQLIRDDSVRHIGICV